MRGKVISITYLCASSINQEIGRILRRIEHWHQGASTSYRILYQDADGQGREVKWDGEDETFSRYLNVDRFGSVCCSDGGGIAGSPFRAGAQPYSVAVDPGGKFAYVANSADNTFSGYKINPATGALADIAGSPFAAGNFPQSVTVDPSGKFVYAANVGDQTGTVSGYAINPATGALTAIGGSPFAAASSSASVAVDPRGKFAYTANSLPNLVAGYTINPATGALAEIAGSPFAAGSFPRSVTVDPSCKFVYAANVGDTSGSVSGYTINPTTAALTAIACSPFAAGSRPWSVVIARAGVRAVYITNEGCKTVSVINPSTNTVVDTTTVGRDPVDADVTPDGSTAYIAKCR
jgi:6-phosphogluconolactonase